MAKAVLVAGHPNATELVRRILLIQGYDVTDVSTPTLALGIVKNGGIDVVVIVLTGTFAEEQVETASRIVTDYAGTAVLAVAPAGTDPAMQERMRQASGKAVINTSAPRWMASVETALAESKK